MGGGGGSRRSHEKRLDSEQEGGGRLPHGSKKMLSAGTRNGPIDAPLCARYEEVVVGGGLNREMERRREKRSARARNAGTLRLANKVTAINRDMHFPQNRSATDRQFIGSSSLHRVRFCRSGPQIERIHSVLSRVCVYI
jgi:hypothetical protein